MNFISECTIACKWHDDDERYIAFSEVKRLFEKYQSEQIEKVGNVKQESLEVLKTEEFRELTRKICNRIMFKLGEQ